MPVARAQSNYSAPYSVSTLVSISAGATSVDGLGVLNPAGVAVDAEGELFVSNPLGYNTIRKVSPAGVPSPLAGDYQVFGSADGAGSAAQFNNPMGVAVDAAGNVYVADTGNDTIRKITPAGVVTTLAGSAGTNGSADGTGSAARFDAPMGIAVDGSGNLYVSEQVNCMIRKITPSGTVTTLAGSPGAKGFADGTGVAAEFDHPSGVAVDAGGNVYVADSINDMIRKITPSGVVSSFAGTPGRIGSSDGLGSAALFYVPTGVAVDGSGNVYVADTGNSTIRMITPSGVVTTLAGTPGATGFPDGLGAAALFNNPSGIAVDAGGNVYIADTGNGEIRKALPYLAPRIQTQPSDQFAEPGASATFSVAASGASVLTYQWSLDGVAIEGATGPSYTISDAQASDAGSYAVTVTGAAGSVTSLQALLTVGHGASAARLVNISTRAQVGTGSSILIPGFVISGSGSESLLIRADGPALSQFGVNGVLAKPVLSLLDATGTIIASNTGWGGSSASSQIASVAASVGAFALAPGSADCALLVSLPTGAYTVQVSGVNGASGIALAEVYEVSSSGTRLVNISTRAQVGQGAGIIFAGFVIGGSGTENLLVRGDGPGLAQFGVAGILAQPVLSVVDSAGRPVASNTGWSTASNAAEIAAISGDVGAFALSPGSADCAQVVALSPGAYTLQVSGANGTTGVALAEVYEAP